MAHGYLGEGYGTHGERDPDDRGGRDDRWHGERDRDWRGGEQERGGFFRGDENRERGGWFGDGHDEDRHREWDRPRSSGPQRDDHREGWGGGREGREHSGGGFFERMKDQARELMSDDNDHRERGMGDRNYGQHRGEYRESHYGREHGTGGFQGDYRGGSQQGGFGGSGNQSREQRRSSHPDAHYLSWRDRQMAELDRDYQDYCREREQQFHSDFGTWRQNRQGQSGSQQQPSGTGQGGANRAQSGTGGETLGGSTGTASSASRQESFEVNGAQDAATLGAAGTTRMGSDT